MSTDNSKLTELIKDTIYCFISPDIQVLGIENIPVGAGSQAVGLSRHKINWKITAENETDPTGTTTTISLEVPGIYLYSKQATFIERSALSRLYSQAANVPYSLSNHPLNEGRSLLVIQDVDVDTDCNKAGYYTNSGQRNVSAGLYSSGQYGMQGRFAVAAYG